MAVTYECAVKKSHQRTYGAAPSVTPTCCNKPMVVTSAGAPAKPPGAPQSTPPTSGPTAGAPGAYKR